ncbi:MAG: methyl-accepting chemotaxis protein [Azoarcus sp.]|nr:methyl-accepting chemotaxis protein [Azoarcus sp.]
MKLRPLLILGFGLILFLLAIVGGLSIAIGNSISASIEDIADRRIPSLITYSMIENQFSTLYNQSLQMAALDAPSAQTTASLNKLRDGRAASWAEVDRLRKKLDDVPNKTEEGKHLSTELASSMNDFIRAFSRLDDYIPMLTTASVANNSHEYERVKSELGALILDAASVADRVQDHLTNLTQRQATLSEQAASEAAGLANTSVMISAILSLAGLVSGVAIGFLIFRAVIRQIGGEPSYIQEVMQRVSNADLSMRVELHSGDTTSALYAVSITVDKLRTLLETISQSADDIAAASEQLSATSKNIAASSESQSQAASSMAAAVEEMTVSVGHVSDSANEANKMARQSGNASQAGAETIHSVVADINRVAREVTAAAQDVAELGSQSREISSVVNIIKEVADQTNLLALNAAIEAARAGEQGRGFAVVADEVRKLAERTASSTEDIARIVALINAGTERAVQTMQHQSESVNSTVSLSEQAGVNIGQINDASAAVVTAVGEISLALSEQSTASTEIANNVERIATMSEDNTTAMREAAAATQSLAAQAEQLQTIVGQFKLG